VKTVNMVLQNMEELLRYYEADEKYEKCADLLKEIKKIKKRGGYVVRDLQTYIIDHYKYNLNALKAEYGIK
jgi:hypothetical protein